MADADGLCGSCWRETPFLLGLVCDLCGTAQIGPDDGTAVHCDACRQLGRPWQKGRAVLEYSGRARRLVLSFKHGDRLDLAPRFARWMAARAVPLLLPDMLLVPVPIHRGRLLKRRYNQAAVLTRLLGRELDLPHLPDALLRRVATPPLKGGGHAERSALLAGAITLTPGRQNKLAGRPVLLVDDVMTSGATLAACTQELRGAGVPIVNVLALARAAQHA